MSNRPRLQNYPAVRFTTAVEWSDYLTRTCAPARVEVPNSAGYVDWQLHGAKLEQLGIAFGYHGSPLDFVQFGGGGGLQIYLPLAGAAELIAGGRAWQVVPGQAVVVDLSQPSRLKVGASFTTLALNIPKKRDQPLARLERTGSGNGRLNPIIDLASGPGAALAGITETLVTGLENDLLLHTPAAIADLSLALLSLFAEGSPSGWSNPSTAAVPRHVRRAIEYMRAHLDEPLTISELAEASQTSVRSLQKGFRDFKGGTPLAYLKQMRLQAVHAELSDPASTLSVAEIAVKWGFVHFGRFSADYRAAFQQLPSAAAKAARQR